MYKIYWGVKHFEQLIWDADALFTLKKTELYNLKQSESKSFFLTLPAAASRISNKEVLQLKLHWPVDKVDVF